MDNVCDPIDGEVRRFSAEEVVIARMALRRAADVPPQTLSLQEFIDAICVEVGILYEAGFVDEEIAVILERSVRYPIPASAVAWCRAPTPDIGGALPLAQA